VIELSYKIFLSLNTLSEFTTLKQSEDSFVTDKVFKVPSPNSTILNLAKEYILHSIRLFLKSLSKNNVFVEIRNYGFILDLNEEEYELLIALIDFDKWFYDSYYSGINVNRDVVGLIHILEYLQIFTLINEKRYTELTERIRRVILSKEI